MNRKAYFFSLDAFIALLIVFGVVLFIKPPSSQISTESLVQQDLLAVLSSVSIGELNNSYAKQLINSGKITNLNQSVLEQIGEFYSRSDEEAGLLAENIINSLNLSDNIGLYFNGLQVAASGNASSDAESIWTSRQIISGIQQGNSTRGYSSRAFLVSKNKVDYFYFGGYVGDGNITVRLSGDVIGANIEAVFSGDFDIYINDVFADSYSPPSGIPYKINLADHLGLFSTGDNYLEFRGTDGNLYIAGGYIKVVYNSSELINSTSVKNFPGITGLINFYDSFYIPGNLNSMEIFLHYNSSYDLFLNIGDKRVYKGNSSGSEASVTIEDSNLSGILNYSEMGYETIPLRLGIENVSYSINYSIDADVFSVTDLSGSMTASCDGAGFWCCFNNYLATGDFCQTESSCISCGGTWEDPLGMAKEANNAFIDIVLNSSGNRVGLVGYSSVVDVNDYHNLSDDNASLKAKVSEWDAGGLTCICCGINYAAQKIVSDSREGSFRSMVVMSDGIANIECSEQGTGDPAQDAIQAACDAYTNYNITVYSVGFGSGADEATLQDIASCGNGNYYYGDVEGLVDVYGQIAQDIISASYFEQTIMGENINTVLYPDSYIFLDYEKDVPYGLVITAETPEFGNTISQGSFTIPNDTVPYEVKVVSYSGSKWTDRVEVYNSSSGIWMSAFNLSEYNLSYTDLGDPYVVNIPTGMLAYGNNSVRVSASIGSSNTSTGSPYDKIIYSLVKELSGYSPIVSSAEGCTWNIEFEDGTNSTIAFPGNYSGSKECYYKSDNIAYNNNDAIDNAVFNLLSDLDLNSNRKVETKFNSDDLTITSTEIEGIPFTWETEVQVRVWR